MKTIQFSSSSYRLFFNINFLHLAALVGYTLTCSLCHPEITAAVGFAAFLPVRWDAQLLPSNLVKHNRVKSSQNIYGKLKISPQLHLLRAIALYVCSCKYNQVPIADLKLTEEEEDLIVLIDHRIINHQCGQQWKRNLQHKELLGKPLLSSKDWEILVGNHRVLLTPHLDSGYNFGHSHSREMKAKLEQRQIMAGRWSGEWRTCHVRETTGA